MVITIDTDEIKEYGLTPNEYVLLHEIHLSKYIISYDEFTFESLIAKGYLDKTTFRATEKALQLFMPKFNDHWEELFIEFWNTYPHIVSNRVLRTEKSNTKLAIECRKKFKKSCYNKIENAKILIEALKNQIKLLQNSTSFNYFQGIEVWLNQNTWEKYVTIKTEEERTESI